MAVKHQSSSSSSSTQLHIVPVLTGVVIVNWCIDKINSFEESDVRVICTDPLVPVMMLPFRLSTVSYSGSECGISMLKRRWSTITVAPFSMTVGAAFRFLSAWSFMRCLPSSSFCSTLDFMLGNEAASLVGSYGSCARKRRLFRASAGAPGVVECAVARYWRRNLYSSCFQFFCSM